MLLGKWQRMASEQVEEDWEVGVLTEVMEKIEDDPWVLHGTKQNWRSPWWKGHWKNTK